MAEIYQLPDSNGNNSVPAWLPYVQNGNGMFGGNGLGGGILGFLIGMLFPRLFGNGSFGGFGNGNGGGNGAGTAYLGNMISNDNGRDMLMQAINNSGERSTTAIAQLSNSLGQDFNLVNSAIQTISTSLNQIANSQGINALQVINAIQAGDSSLSAQFQQCCCQNQLALANQTNTLQNGMLTGFNGVQQGINGVSQAIAAKSAADQLYDTVQHELKHVTEHLSEYYDLNPKGETAAYLQGEVARLMFPAAAMLMCPQGHFL